VDAQEGVRAVVLALEVVRDLQRVDLPREGGELRGAIGLQPVIGGLREQAEKALEVLEAALRLAEPVELVAEPLEAAVERLRLPRVGGPQVALRQAALDRA